MSGNTDDIKNAIYGMIPSFKQTLPMHVDAEKFAKVVVTAIMNDADLLTADRRTLYASAARAAEMGLLPDKREGAIVLFKGKCQFMPMVTGLKKLVRNSGEISTWSIEVVHENDHFDYALGDNPHIIHKPVLNNRGAVVGAYSVVSMKDGGISREVIGLDDIEKIRTNSPSANSPAWKIWYGEMARKSVARRHFKNLPVSTDIQGLLREDDAMFIDSTDNGEHRQEAKKSERPSGLQTVIDSTAKNVDPVGDDDLPI